MAYTPGSLSGKDNVKADALKDRIKAWRADYEAAKVAQEAAAKAKREARIAEIRAKLAAIPKKPAQ
jgi:hypothetical protein